MIYQNRTFLCIITCIVCGTLVTSCGNPAANQDINAIQNSSAESNDNETANSEGPLVVWGQYDLTDQKSEQSRLMSERINTFEEETAIEVIYEQIAWDQLATRLAVAVQSGGDVPDVVESGSQHIPALLSAGALSQLDQLVENELWIEEMNENDTATCIYNGSRYCVSTMVRSGITYYQTADFPDGFPETNTDFLSAAERLHEEQKFMTSFYAAREYASVELTWGQWIYSNGGRLFDDEGKPAWATPQTVEVLEFGRELATRGYIPEANFTGDLVTAEVPWIENQTGSFRGGTWSVLFIDGLAEQFENGDVDIAGGISFNNNEPTIFLNSENWVVPEGAQNPQAAIMWMQNFMEPEFLASWCQASSGLPTLTPALETTSFDSAFYAEVADLINNQGKMIEQSPYYQESLDGLATAIQEIMLDPSIDIMEHIQQAQDEILNRYW
ncbi:MAG: hypothetical protein GFH23_1086674n80 [Chloroflexi bacterium AL-N1]|nr:hypothetical protein [Chloroflexi bacterium AL-N1]NOK92199.1 hypothetical protein [Chloroflexi bacterium AL-N15]